MSVQCYVGEFGTVPACRSRTGSVPCWKALGLVFFNDNNDNDNGKCDNIVTIFIIILIK